MLPRDSLGLAPVLRPGPANAVEALGDPRQQAFQRALAGQLGKSMQGQVLARLADGSAVVRVAGTAARMPLPPGAEVGSDVPLKLVALNPRPTFELGSGQNATLVEASAALLPAEAEQAAAAAPGAAALFTPHGEEAPVLYRPDGRAPSQAPLAGPAQQPAAGAAPQSGSATSAASAGATRQTTAATTAPLPTPAPAAMAEHGAALSAAGQVLGSVMAAVLKLGQPARAVAARAPALAAPTADPAQLAPALRQALEQSGLFYESHVAAWANGERDLAALAAEPQAQSRPAAPTDGDTAQLINLQLSAQEQDRVAWDGQLWPGQPMQWEISRDPERQAGGGQDPEQAVWQSRLRLRFPLLGELDATVVLHGGQVALRVDTSDADGAALLQAHAAALADALAAAGTPLSALAISARDGHE